MRADLSAPVLQTAGAAFRERCLGQDINPVLLQSHSECCCSLRGELAAWGQPGSHCALQVDGWDNLPKNTEAAVYIANHQSFLVCTSCLLPPALCSQLHDQGTLQDIFTLFQLDRPFKFVSKTSNFLIPIVGWSMFLTGQAPLSLCRASCQMSA